MTVAEMDKVLGRGRWFVPPSVVDQKGPGQIEFMYSECSDHLQLDVFKRQGFLLNITKENLRLLYKPGSKFIIKNIFLVWHS